MGTVPYFSMETIQTIADVFVHLDKNLAAVISQFGPLTYVLLFLIIFLETGIVITPFLPGDSLLFAAGTLSVSGSLNIFFLYIDIHLCGYTTRRAYIDTREKDTHLLHVWNNNNNKQQR